MALSRYVLTSAVTLPAGPASAISRPGGTVTYAQGGGVYGSAGGVTFIKGTVIELDPAGAALRGHRRRESPGLCAGPGRPGLGRAEQQGRGLRSILAAWPAPAPCQ